MYSRETNLGKSEEVISIRRKGEMAYGFAQGKAAKQNFTHWKEEGRGKEVGQRSCLQVEKTQLAQKFKMKTLCIMLLTLRAFS